MALSVHLAWLLASILLCSPLTLVNATTNPLSIEAYKFFDSVTGESVAFKGLVYYPRPNSGDLDVSNLDFFNDDYQHIWERDIEYFKLLGINAIRIYSVDPSKDHDGFMCALQAAGIYVIVGLAATCSSCSITLDTAPNCYPPDLKSRGQLIINAFSKYDNVLGFEAGNEVSFFVPTTVNGPCLKKFVRDMRAYLASCSNLRPIPIGVVVADVTAVQDAAYYNCLTDANDLYENIEWFGLNAYRDCDSSVNTASEAGGLISIRESFLNYSIPLLLTEFGCIGTSFPTVDGYATQRPFQEVAFVFDSAFEDYMTGAFIYEYSVESYKSGAIYPFDGYSPENYGVGYFSPMDCNETTTPCSYNPKPEFFNLASTYTSVSSTGSSFKSSFAADPNRLSRSDCPSSIPSLSNFTWASDSITDLYCASPSTLVCSAPTLTTPSPETPSDAPPSVVSDAVSKTPTSPPSELSSNKPSPVLGDKKLSSSPAPVIANITTGIPTVFIAQVGTSVPMTRSEPSGQPTGVVRTEEPGVFVPLSSQKPSLPPTQDLSNNPTSRPSEEKLSASPTEGSSTTPTVTKSLRPTKPPTAMAQAKTSGPGEIIGTPPVKIKAFKFFDSLSGQSIAFKGVAYYPRPNAGELNKNNIDFFHEAYRNIWERDIVQFRKLGLNAIRIYSVDPGKDHSGFMCALQEAGIYVLVGLAANCQNCSITKDESPLCYPDGLKQRGEQIINTFSRYDNVLAFEAGNEVGLVAGSVEINAPCQKKFVRDMRAYIDSCAGMRKIPVGVVVADTQRMTNADYYNCQANASDPYEYAEFLGLNAYQNCDPSVVNATDAIGFQMMKSDFENYSIPLMLTEYGCLNPGFPNISGFEAQRTFYQSRWIYQEFKDIFAGGFVFEYSVEADNAGVPPPYDQYSPGNYGIGYFLPGNCTDSNITCVYNHKPEFANLMARYAETITKGVVNLNSFQPPAARLQRSTCPTDVASIGAFLWSSDATSDLTCPSANPKFVCPFLYVDSEPPSIAPTLDPYKDIATILPTATIRGTPPLDIQYFKFFDSTTGESVALKGINYNPRPNSGMLDTVSVDYFHSEYAAIWERDLEYFKDLGVNAIRIYAVDPSKDHDGFMCALQEAGIYVLVDLSASCENCAVTYDDAPACYPAALRERGEYIISQFSKYDNVLAFTAGTDMSENATDLMNYGPCLKKFVRDMRAFVNACSSIRSIPVGVALTDNMERTLKASYYNCDSNSTDELENAEWLGLNAFQHCNSSVVRASQAVGFQKVKADFANLSIPLLLTEYGCLNSGFRTIDGYQAQRNFLQSRWIFESEFREEIAGGFAFEYSTEMAYAGVSFPFKKFSRSNFGIGYFSPADCTDVDIPCEYNPKPEFDNLARSYHSVMVRDISDRRSFMPDASRLSRPFCPSEIPSISSFTWPSDTQVSSITCPPDSASSFVCPFWQSPTLGTSPARSPSSTSSGQSSAGIRERGPLTSMAWTLLSASLFLLA